ILTFSGAAANTYTGATTVSTGELDLAKTAGTNAVPAALTINGGILKLLAANEIADGFPVTVAAPGSLNLNNFNETIGPLTLTGSQVASGTGVLTLGGDVTTNPSATPAGIAGNVSLGAIRTFTIAS